MKSHEHTLVHVHKHNARSHSEHERSVWRVLRRPSGIGWVAFGSALLLLTSMGPSCGSPGGGPLLPDADGEQVLDYQPSNSTGDPSGTSDPSEPSSDTTATWPQLTIQASAVEGVAPLEVILTAATLDGTASPSGNYAWDFGDGAVGSGQQVAHTYTRAAVYTVTLVLTVGAMDTPDSAPLASPQSVTATTTVAVSEPPPLEPDSQPLGISTEYEVIEGEPFQFVLSANSANDNTRFTVIALPANGAVNVPSGTGLDSPVLTYTPGTDFVGEDTLTFVAYDSAHTTPQAVLGIPYAIVKFRVRHKATLVTSPDSGLMATGNQGGPFSPDSVTYTLLNTGEQTLYWSAAGTQNWLTFSKTSGALAVGAMDTVTVSINYLAHSLAAGSYDDTVTFKNETNNVGNTSRPVHLTVNELPGVLAVSPSTGLAAVGNPGGPFAPASVTYTLSNTGGATLAWTAVKGQNWVAVSKPNGELAGGATDTVVVSINANANALSAGSYTDSVIFTNTTHDIGNTTRPVSLAVGGIPISGTITRVIAGGGTSPVSGLSLTFTGSGASSGQDFTATTATDGAYVALVPIGWSGSLAATDPDTWRLIPASRVYTNAQAAQAAQHLSASRNYYVATTGSDSNAGTLAAPFATPQKAADLAQPGDSVYFRTGTYFASGAAIIPVIQINNGGEFGSPITYANYGGEVPVFDAEDYHYRAVQLGIPPSDQQDTSGQGVSYVILQGLVAQGATKAGISICGPAAKAGFELPGPPTTEVTVRHCVGQNNHGSGISTVGTVTTVLIELCETRANWNTGILLSRLSKDYHIGQPEDDMSAARNSTVRNCLSYLNDSPLTPGNTDGISASHCYRCRFDDNVVFQNSDDGIDIYASVEATISGNIAFSHHGSLLPDHFGEGNGTGIKASAGGGGEHVFLRNICLDNMGFGFETSKPSLPLLPYRASTFYHNLSCQAGTVGFSIGNDAATGTWILRNNIGLNSGSRDFRVWSSAATDSDYNLWRQSDTADAQKVGQDMHSLSGDPMFQDPRVDIDTNFAPNWTIEQKLAFVRAQVSSRFSVGASSPCVDSGAVLSEEYVGNGPDIGPFDR